LFNPEQLISGKEDAANNFARGRFSEFDTLIKRVELIVFHCSCWA